MTITQLAIARINFISCNKPFFTDIFTKSIWGGMGEDIASITLTVIDNSWHLHFIRTQSGQPYPFSDTVCNVIDEYEKNLSDEELYEFLAHHSILNEFEWFSDHPYNELSSHQYFD